MKLLNSFKIKSNNVDSDSFEDVALDLFHYQANNCLIYKSFIQSLNVDLSQIDSISKIPFLPIDFFKYHKIQTGDWKQKEVFKSSGTTNSQRSIHYIEDVSYYLSNAKRIYEAKYSPLKGTIIFALLPSYQEQGHSSLVKMVDYFISESGSSNEGGFYLNQIDELIADLSIALNKSENVVLFGVGYALLDLVEVIATQEIKLDGLQIIETGGMKGRRKDMIKGEFYEILKNGLGDVKVDSEYGMTELLSQAYSTNETSYVLPNQMQVLIRDPEDPFNFLPEGKVGGLNIIDLANVHSCAFIETKDLAKKINSREFEILGRLDNSDIRGCNLMVV